MAVATEGTEVAAALLQSPLQRHTACTTHGRCRPRRSVQTVRQRAELVGRLLVKLIDSI